MGKIDPQSAATWVVSRIAVLDRDACQPNVAGALARLHKRQKGERKVGNRWVWGVSAVGIVCVAALVLPSPKALAHRCLECSVAVWQSLAAPVGDRKAKLTIESDRKAAPDFELKDETGKDVRFSDFKGQVAIVNFWATWCEGCQLEIPWFVEFQKKYKERGLAIVGVSMDDDGWKAVTPWLKEKKINYAIVIGNEASGKSYGLSAMPLTVLIDRNGKIASAHAGVINRQATERNIRKLLQESARGE
jgi:peroxiredoxin